MKKGFSLQFLLVFIFLTRISSTYVYPQLTYDWKLQNNGRYVGPQQIESIQVTTITPNDISFSGQVMVSSPEGISYTVNEGADWSSTHPVLVAFNATTGEFLWNKTIPSQSQGIQVNNLAINSQGNIIIGGQEGYPDYMVLNVMLELDSQGNLVTEYTWDQKYQYYYYNLGPNDEIILSTYFQWGIVNVENTAPFPGYILACDDYGGIYVLNETGIYATNLSDPTNILWEVTCPDMALCDDINYYQAAPVGALSWDQSAIIITYSGSESSYVVSISTTNGKLNWKYSIDNTQGDFFLEIVISADYIFVMLPSSVLSLTSQGAYAGEFLNGNNFYLQVDLNNIVSLVNGTQFITATPQGDIISSTPIPALCPDYPSFFYTTPNFVWVYCQDLVQVLEITTP